MTSDPSHSSSASPRLRGSSVVGIIPARLAATRLPNKPLLELAGKPMIQWVWERARSAPSLSDVLIATPDREIFDAVEAFGGRAVMTSDLHRSGTDRLAEAAGDMDADIIVNIQGDEPLIDPELIERVIQPLLADETLPMTSAMCPCPEAELDLPSTVKVVTNLAGDALYFSRARIPFQRAEASALPVMQHIGIYSFQRDFLLRFAALPPSPLEQIESLEQLRALENGYRIRLVMTNVAPMSVDTEDDLGVVRRLILATT